LVLPAGPADALVAPPTLIKGFDDSSIPLNGTTILSLDLSNPNATTTLTGISFTDVLPAGLVISTPITGTLCGGPYVISATSISWSDATVAPDEECGFDLEVRGTTLGPKVNTTSAVTSTNGGTANPVTATVVVGAPPILTKAFLPPTIAVGSTTSLTFTLVNFNAAPLTGAAFTDTLPAGLVVASPTGLSNTCGGTATAAAGSSSIALTGRTIPASSNCVVSVNVRATSAGTKTNTTSEVTTTEGLTGFPSTASLEVAGPPILTKAFAPSTVPVGATTTLTFTLTNPNPTTPLTRITFADPLPLGLMVAAVPSVINNCGGVPSVGPYALAVAYANGQLPAGGTCTFSVNVTATSPGVKNNTTTIVSSSGGIGRPATAGMTVT
jgi:uncharacterized repeat protein (TIGR01451 family)